MDVMAELWRRIDLWFETFAPAYANAFFPGVTEEDLVEAEAVLGVTLPPAFKASYRIHNGAQCDFVLLGYPDFYQLSAGLSIWKDKQELFPKLFQQDAHWATKVPYWVEQQEHFPVQPVWWHSAWLDFAGNGAGDTWCIDLAPAIGGHIGQVLSWSHEVGVGGVLFPSFEALLSTYADQLEAGLYVQHGLPLIRLEQLTHLKERRAAFQQLSPAKPVLHQAIRSAWNLYFDGSDVAYNKAFEECIAIYRQVLQMQEATPDDRFFAYYGLISLYKQERVYIDDPSPAFFEQWEAEALRMPPTHWVHEEVALWGAWFIR